MLNWLLQEIEKADELRDVAVKSVYANDDRDTATNKMNYLSGKIDAYKEVLKFIEDASRKENKE